MKRQQQKGCLNYCVFNGKRKKERNSMEKETKIINNIKMITTDIYVE
jgi:hypothetical protein